MEDEWWISFEKVSTINTHPPVQDLTFALCEIPKTGYLVAIEKCVLTSVLDFIYI